MNKKLIPILLFAPAPSLGVCLALFNFNDFLGSFLWFLAKLWLYGGVFYYLFFIDKIKFQEIKLTKAGIKIGFFIGFLMALTIFLAFLIFKENINQEELKIKVFKSGLNSLNLYLIISLYFSFINSYFEEIIFRLFFYQKSLALVNKNFLALIMAALIFTLHHSLILYAYSTNLILILGSFSIFLAAIIWSFLYAYYKSLTPSYIAHIFADLMIFGIAGYLIFY